MTIQRLISQSVPPLLPRDTVEHALGMMLEFRVRHLPVVDREERLLGVISEDQLLDAYDAEAPISTLLGPAAVQAKPDAHVFDITKQMIAHDLTTLPVADATAHYFGLIRRHDLFEQFARMLSTHESGAILALEVSDRDHSLSQMVYTIEETGAKVLSVSTELPDETSEHVRITLKLNVSDTARIRHVLEHRGYRIVASFSEQEDDEDLQDRIDAFMRYLEV